MGGGCFRAKTGLEEPLRSVSQRYTPEQKGRRSPSCDRESPSPVEATTVQDLKAELGSVLQVAGKCTSNSATSDAKLDETIESMSGVQPPDAAAWFREWLLKAPSKSRTGLVLLMQRVLARALDANVVVAEELVAAEGADSTEVLDVCHLADVCRDALRVDSMQQKAIETAVLVLSAASSMSLTGAEGNSAAPYIVSVFDRIVQLFRPSLLAHIGSSAKNLQQWRELEEYAGLPPLENHLCLLSCSSKAALLSMLMVPENAPPVALVVTREDALIDAGPRLPGRACVLSPYFQSATGTKVVQGMRVEGGEGHGPRKEFFIATSSEALRQWGPPRSSTPSSASGPPRQVEIEGNQISLVNATASDSEGARAVNTGRMFSRCIAQAKIGERIRLEIAGGTELQRTIRAVHGEHIVVDTPLDEISSPSSVTRCLLQRPAVPLFEFHRGTGLHWFGAYANELDSGSHAQTLRNQFVTFGKLLALALANCCKISFSLPVIFFRLLLASETSVALDDLQGFDDVLHASLKKCLKMGQAEFTSLLQVDGLPSSTKREEYVANQVKSILMPEAMQEVRKGFWSLAQRTHLGGIGATDLRQIVCPMESSSTNIDIRKIFKVVMEEEMSECQLFVDVFWSVIDDFSLAEKRSFLRFVTGLEAPPEPGTERLVIELPFSAFSKDEHMAMLSMLPQAHTCTNTLELPNYHDALRHSGIMSDGQSQEVLAAELHRVLSEKLRLAINETGSYELDAVEPEGGSPPSRQPPPGNAGAGRRSDAGGGDRFASADELKTGGDAGPHSTSAGSSMLAEPAGDNDRRGWPSGTQISGAACTDESEHSSSASVLVVEERPPLLEQRAHVHSQPEKSAMGSDVDGFLEDPSLLTSFPFLQQQQQTSAHIGHTPGKISHDIDSLIEELELDLAIGAQAPQAMLSPKESLT